MPRLDFEHWGQQMDAHVLRLSGRTTKEITAPYAEMWLDGLSPEEAALAAVTNEGK